MVEIILGITAAVCAFKWLQYKVGMAAVMAWAYEKGLEPDIEEINKYVPEACKALFGVK